MSARGKLVIKVGGSILFKNENLDITLMSTWVDLILGASSKCKLAIVVGGGKLARKYIDWARDLNLSEFFCDTIGIHVSRLNAMLVLGALRTKNKTLKVAQRIPTNPFEVAELISLYNIVVCGGFIPGQSTVGVASEVAEAVGSKYMLVATDVDGIYSKDPKKFPDAIRYRSIGISELMEQFKVSKHKAGTYRLFDMQSLKILERSKIICIVFNGRKIEIAKKVVEYVLRENVHDIEDLATVVYPD